MNWKNYYLNELRSPNIEERLNNTFADVDGKATPIPCISPENILSFPHTALRYAGPLQAQVIVGLHQAKVKRIIALGVFHAWGHEISAKTYSLAMDETQEAAQRVAAFKELRGAFVPSISVQETPFGSIYLTPPSSTFNVALREDTNGFLANEFSLDTFMSLLSFYYRLQGEAPPVVTPLYIGMTRNPVAGSFAIASQLAATLRSMWLPGDAVVATGDLVHYGTAYSPQERMMGMPTGHNELSLYFQREVKHTLAISLKKRDYTEAFRRCDTLLNNDQRYLLPIIAEIFPYRAGYELLSFSLSDYSAILNAAKPCVVASTLVLYKGQTEKRNDP